MAVDLERAPTREAGADSWQPASLSRRFGALLLDWLLCSIVSRLFFDPMHAPWAPSVALILEYGLCLGLLARTPGMALCRIRCVPFRDGAVRDGGVIGIPRALLRGFLLALLVPALIMDGDRRGLHDRAAGSIVIG